MLAALVSFLWGFLCGAVLLTAGTCVRVRACVSQ